MAMTSAQRHGWFVIPGLQTGHRHLADQLLGLEDALLECKGKTVLDLGCAEGLISHEFARRGAASVHGVEVIEAHMMVAMSLGQGLSCTFECANLNKVVVAPTPPRRYDIVLALAVLHKLWDPHKGVEWAARSAGELLLLRTGRRYEGETMVSKRTTMKRCHVPTILKGHGFVLEKVAPGSKEHDESIQYWRRTA